MGHFNLLAPRYDKLIGKYDADRLFDFIGMPNDGLLLDAGGGTGRVARELCDKFAHIVVADNSFGMLRQGITRNNLLYVCTPIESLPFAPDAFRFIVMVDAFHHVIDQRITVAELWRVLSPGGKIIIEEPDIRHWIVKIIALLEKAALMRSHFLDVEKIEALFNFTGAEIDVVNKEYTSWVIVEKPASRF